jgi:hypothetical protein
MIHKLNEDIANCESTEIHIFLTNKRNYLQSLKTNYEKKINEMCVHEFEDDLVDIDPDRSICIRYCKICEYTLH